MRKILRLGGASCTGKTTVVNMLNAGLGYLFAGTALEKFMGDAIGISVPKTLIEAKESNVSETEWAEGLMSKWEKTALAIEEPYVGSDFSAAFPGLDVSYVQLVMPYYMWVARRQWRFNKGRTVTASWVQQGTKEQYAEYAEKMQGDCHEDTVFIGVADYPVVEIDRRDVKDFMLHGNREFVYTPEDSTDRSSPKDYHRALLADGEWYGDENFVNTFQKRFRETLPADMNGMSVIDIGAAEGAFSFACAERGATFVVSCERMPHRVETLKGIRDATQAPISTVNMTVGFDPLPNFVSRDGRYDVALMLNVLRHLKNPEARLREALSITNCLICETVVEDGEWATVGTPPRQSFSEQWMRRVGDECGFEVFVTPPAIESADTRKKFIFERSI